MFLTNSATTELFKHVSLADLMELGLWSNYLSIPTGFTCASTVSCLLSRGHIYMCTAEVQRSAGYNSGGWNKHMATILPQKKIPYYLNLLGRKLRNVILLSKIHSILINNIIYLLAIKFCLSWLIITANMCTRL